MELIIVILAVASLCFGLGALSLLLQLEDSKRLKNEFLKHIYVYREDVEKLKEEIARKQDHLDAIEILLNLEE